MEAGVTTIELPAGFTGLPEGGSFGYGIGLAGDGPGLGFGGWDPDVGLEFPPTEEVGTGQTPAPEVKGPLGASDPFDTKTVLIYGVATPATCAQTYATPLTVGAV
jgi:hypothetical protein